jgi:signal transduction histidine kinase
MWNLFLDPILGAVVLYYTAALVLLLAYLAQRDVPRQVATALWLALLPSIGWGLWRHQRMEAAQGAAAPPVITPVLSRMGTLHAVLLAASLMHVLAIIFGDWTIQDPLGPDSIASRSGNASAVGFDLLLSGMEAMFGLLLFFFILVFYGAIFLFASVLPWFVASAIRRSHERARLQELEERVRNHG